MNDYGMDPCKQKMKRLDEQVFSKIKLAGPDRVRELDSGYRIEYFCCADEDPGLPGHAAADGEICRLYQNGELLFEWKHTDGASRMAKIVHHSSGNDYLVFDEALYGYSVLDLKSLDCMHYLPAESYGESPEAFEETFIWCDCYYQPQTDLLAVEGCYWAGLYDVIVLDFSHPMIAVETRQWFDVYEKHRDAYPDLCEIAFEKWDGSRLVCKASFLKQTTNPLLISTDFGPSGTTRP